MKVLLPQKFEIPFFHLFLYGAPGAGKTKFIGDFHEAGFPVVRVSCERDVVCLPARGVFIPTIAPTSEDELRAIIEVPDQVIKKVINKVPGLETYEPKTFAFDNLRQLQRVVFGAGATPLIKVFDGEVELPACKDSGIMALPNRRDATGVPSNKDYRLLDLHMRSLLSTIEEMPYHTIVTSHEERDFDILTKLSLTGDPDKDKLVSRSTTGYPALEGFSLKYDLPGLISDFYMRLTWTDGRYFVYPQPAMGYHARTRINQVMPPSLDWTNRNGYHLLEEKYKQAQSEQEKHLLSEQAKKVGKDAVLLAKRALENKIK
ncbi:MAG: hypothetical protein ACRD2L_01475 [Terriglobia bacterium]